MSKTNILTVVLIALAWIGLGFAAFAQGSPKSSTDVTTTSRTGTGADVLTPPTIVGQSRTDCDSKPVTSSNEASGVKTAKTVMSCNN